MIARPTRFFGMDARRRSDPVRRRAAAAAVALGLLAMTLHAPRDTRIGGVALAQVDGPGKILIVSSDRSVAKYAAVQAAFEASVGVPTVEVDVAATSEAQLRRMIARTDPDLIYCIGSNAYQAAADATRSKPILFSSAINWQRFPNRKQTRVIANELPVTAQLTLFRHFFPSVRRIGVVFSPAINRQWLEDAVRAGGEVGIEVVGSRVRRAGQVGDAVRELASGVDALWLTPDPVVLGSVEEARRYFNLAESAGVPVFAYSPAFIELGPVLVVGPDMATIGRQAAWVARDWENARDVSSPVGSEVTLNLKRVQRFRMDFNHDALDAVNHLIR